MCCHFDMPHLECNKMKRSDIVTNIPKEILDAYKKINLDIDIMFVNKCTYFTTILQHILIALHTNR